MDKNPSFFSMMILLSTFLFERLYKLFASMLYFMKFISETFL